MSSCSNSVNKYIIVEPSAESGTFSGLTVCGGGGITVDFITGCTSDGVQIEGAQFQGNTLTVPTLYASTISGSTFYGVTDSYMTGGTYSAGFITFKGNNNFSDVIVDVSALLDDTNTYVTGGTVNGGTLTLTRNDGVGVIVTGFSQTFTGNTSSTCITDLYVSNIHSCSPLHINPNDEGKIYFGSTSGITIDVTNPSISIGGEDVSDNTTLQVWTSGNTQRAIRMRDKVTNSQFNMWTTTVSTGENVLKLDEDTSGSTVATFYGTGIIESNFAGDGSRLYNIPLSGVTNLQTELDSKLNISDFNTYSGNVQTQIDNKLDITTFNTYSGSVQTELNTKISGATNLSSEGVFAQKNGLNLEFKGLTSTGGTVNISSNSNTVNLEVLFPTDQNTYVTGLTFNPSTYDLTIKQNNGEPDLTSNLSVLATDVYVVSGVYDVSTGIVTYTNSSGGTFQVSGFTTGMTDSYTTAANLNGETIEFNNNIQGSNLYSVDLTPLLSGKTNNIDFVTHTGDTNNPHQTSFSNLISTAHTHTISDVVSLQTELDSKLDTTTFTTYTADTQTELDGKIGSTNNVGGSNELFKDKSGTTLNFRTLSGGSNTTISTIGDVVKVDVSIPASMNTYVTGFTYDDVNTFTIGRNDGTNLTSTISVLSGITYYGDGSNLDGISSSDFYVTGGTYTNDVLTLNRGNGTVDIDLVDVYLTGGTLNVNTLELYRKGGLPTISIDLGDLSPTGSTIDTYLTGATLNGNTLELYRNQGEPTISVDLSQFVDDTNYYVTGGTVIGTDLVLGRNGGLSDVTIDTSSYFDNTDNYVTGATYSNANLYFSGTSSETTFTVDVSALLDDTNDGVVSGATMNGNTLELSRTQGLSNVTVDLSQFDNNTDRFVTGATMNGNTLELSRSGGLSDVTVDLSQFVDDTNFYVTGGTVSGTDLILGRNGGLGDITIDTSSYFDNTDNYVTGGTYSNDVLTLNRTNGSLNIDLPETYVTGATLNGNNLEITRNQGEPTISVDLSQFDDNTDRFVSGGTYSNGNLLFSGNSSETTFTVDVSALLDDTNNYVTGGTVSGTDLVLYRSGGLSNVVIDTSAYFDNTDRFVTGATMNGNVLELSRSGGLSDVTVDLSQFVDDTNYYVTGGTYNSGSLTLDRNDGNSVVVTGFLTGNTLQEVLVNGNTSGGNNIVMSESDDIIFKYGGFNNNINTQPLTTNRNILFPDKDGTVALLSDTTGHTENYYVTGFTYNDANVFTLSRNGGLGDLSVTADTMENLTITDTLISERFTNLNAVTASTISELDYIDFNTTYTPTQQEGRLHWDADFGTLDVDLEGNTTQLKVGLDNLYYIKNQSGTTIEKGKVVRAAGTLGNSGRILGEYMIADGTIPFYYTLGIAGEDIPDGEDGYVYEFGLIKGFDTTGSDYSETWSGGTILYVHPTIPGGLTSVEPTEPNLKIQMAIVINAASNGSLFVRPSLGYNLGDLHNIQTSGETDGDLISYNSSQGYWDYTKSLRGDYTISGSLSASTISAGTINATTYNNLPVDPNYYVTGATYLDGLYTFDRNDGNSFSVQGGSNYSAGVIEGSSGWTATGTGQINLPEVKVALYDNPKNIEPLRVYTVGSGTTGSGGITSLTNEDTNYVVIDYNGGSPTWDVLTSYDTINDSSILLVYTIYRLNNFIHILDFGDFGAGLPNKLNDRILLTERFKRETGLSLGLSGSTGVVTLTEGIAWNGSNRQVIAEVNSQDDVFFKNYHVGGNWAYTTTGNTINNTFYDDGTDLVTATGGKYLVNWYFRGQEVNDHLYEVYGTSQYDSIADAELSLEPALPELITSHAFLTGRIIVGVGQNTGYTQSAFVTTFQSTNIQDHDDLTGLQGGAAGEYYHLTASQLSNNAYTNTNNNFSTDQTVNGTFIANTISASTYQNLPVDPNYYVTGGTVSGTDLLLNRNDGSTVTIDTSPYFDNTDRFVTGGTVSGTDLVLSRSGGLSDVTIDTSAYFDNTDNYITGGTLNNNSIELNRTDTLNVLTISGASGIVITEPTTGVFAVQSTGGAGGGESNTASNLGGGTGLFAQKSGVDLQFKSITSTGDTITVSNDSTTVNVEVKNKVNDANQVFSWFMNVT